MKKLALLILLFVLAGASAQAQNIVKSLERNVPGQGKVTIHQDPRIEAMIGMERLATGEQKVMKGCISRSWQCIRRSIRPVGFVVWVISGV